MTREEAIAHGKEQLEIFGGTHREFIEMAIEALEQYPILDKLRAEIERQEKWLMVAGYNQYNVDIALDAIKSVIDKCKAESENP